jgi:asparagine synthase (glutamine-hydrolysing)
MCGIWGILPFPGGLIPSAFDAISATVRHRGPDDEGVVYFPSVGAPPIAIGGRDTPKECFNAGMPYSPSSTGFTGEYLIALGHRRLSIVDLSPAGHQPMSSSDQRLWIVYNGEIYNHPELREELRSLGHEFRSQSDTEVILAAYRQWGHGCLDRLNGMFAFLLYDATARKLFLARDRFGIKPLYYWASPSGFLAFASEIKQFTVLPGWHPRVNGQRAYDFVNWAVSDHTDGTLFEGVFQLRGGEALELDVGGERPFTPRPGARLPTYRWYDLKPSAFSGSFEDAGHELKRLLTDSVRLRLRADVPVGSCLSGGLDSSSIVCLMNGLLHEQDARAFQKTFSACSDVKRFDEREYIEEVVRHTGTDAHYIYPRIDDLFQLLDDITWHQDEPFGSTSIFAQWNVFRLAAEANVKVMLDGQGADEQLAGYHNYFAPHFGRLLRRLRWTALWHELQDTSRLHGYSLTWGIKQALNNVLPEVLRQPLRRLAGKPGGSVPWLDLARLRAVPRDPFLDAGAAKAETVQEMSRSQFAATSLPMLLHWEDRDSMAHSIEARVPFLDYRLVEFVLGLPDEYKISGGMTKRVLRGGMQGVLPERVRNRVDKLGFVTPEEVWVREQSPDLFRQALRDTVDVAGAAVKSDVLTMLEETIAGRRPFDFLIWRLISFGRWIRRYSVEI